MTYSPADSRIFAPLFSDSAIAAIFSDAAYVAELIRVEVALAVAQGDLGIIPHTAADAIKTQAPRLEPDWVRLQKGTEQAGVPVIELVAQLRDHLGEAGGWVHWGATTQDVFDTTTVLQSAAALVVLEQRMVDVIRRLAHLADHHRTTVMAGRTHSQQALPVTVGLKVAGWISPLLRHLERLQELRSRLLTVQFAGAAGTLAALGADGLEVQRALATELGLAVPEIAWHTQRDRFAELGNWLSMVSGSLAKMAQDLILMAQSEIGEVRESTDSARGTSSTMPQKSNPMTCEAIIAMARANAQHLASMHHAQIQEHERATHGWQLEWLSLSQMFGNSGAALSRSLTLVENLVINRARIQENIARSNGLMLAEALSFALVRHMTQADARQIVRNAVQVARDENRHLVDIVRDATEVDVDWQFLRDEANYLGCADAMIDQLLARVALLG